MCAACRHYAQWGGKQERRIRFSVVMGGVLCAAVAILCSAFKKYEYRSEWRMLRLVGLCTKVKNKRTGAFYFPLLILPSKKVNEVLHFVVAFVLSGFCMWAQYTLLIFFGLKAYERFINKRPYYLEVPHYYY